MTKQSVTKPQTVQTSPTNRSTKQPQAAQSFGQRVWQQSFANLGAKIGLIWVMILVFVAVFAPFLANSAPLLVWDQDGIHAPVLHYLTAEDVIVLGTLIALFVWRWLHKRYSCPFRLLISSFVAFMMLLIIASNLWVQPPKLINYADFRQTQDHYFTLNAPIPYSPKDYLRDQQNHSLQAPLSGTRTHWMGTDENGSDVMSRMIHASRIALGIGFVATGIAMGIGIIIGGVMGYFSGLLDMLGMRLVEIFEAIPTLFLLLIFVAVFEPSIYLMMVIIGITSWSGYARYVRAEFLKLRQQDYIQAAIASGLSLPSILFRHMLPNGVAPLLVAASFGVASAILAEATLSFLGLGSVESPSWGYLLNQSVQSSTFNWWMAIFPGGAIFMTVFSYNLIGEALRDAIDPQLSRKAGINHG
ncbi:MAG: ABC transporter permease [bacterium]